MTYKDEMLASNVAQVASEMNINQAGIYDASNICLWEVKLCMAWLELSSEHTFLGKNTYTLKHVVETWADEQGIEPTYVSNGAFMVAAVLCGYGLERIKNTQNAKVVSLK